MRRDKRTRGHVRIGRGSLLIVLALVATGSGIASAAHPNSRPAARVPVLHLAFRRVTIPGYVATTSRVLSNGRYLYVGTPAGPNGQLGLLYNDQAGTAVTITGPAACQPVSMGGPWLLFDCGRFQSPALALYSLSRGVWRSVVLNAALQGINAQCAISSSLDPNCGVWAGAVGADWIALGEGCGYHCGSKVVFQNLQTGRTESNPTGGPTIADLSSPVLARRLCSPLRVSGSSTTTGTGIGGSVFDWMGLFGRFAISTARASKDGSHMVLERCGSKLRVRLGGPGNVAANSRAVLWRAGPHRITGILLPSLRRVAVAVRGTVLTGPIVLGRRRLYAISAAGDLWTALLPL